MASKQDHNKKVGKNSANRWGGETVLKREAAMKAGKLRFGLSRLSPRANPRPGLTDNQDHEGGKEKKG